MVNEARHAHAPLDGARGEARHQHLAHALPRRMHVRLALGVALARRPLRRVVEERASVAPDELAVGRIGEVRV